MKIIIIIPILNPPDTFFTNIVSMLKKQNINNRIVLLNSGNPIPSGDYDIQSINQKNFNHANTRNIALEYSADYYLFMTQDATPCDETLIQNLLQPFKDPDVVAAYARQLPYPNADPIERFARETNYPKLSKVKTKNDLPTLGIKTFFNSDSCAMYCSNYFHDIKGFKKDLNTNEDMEYAARAIMNNKKVAYAADAHIFHSHCFTLQQIWDRYRELGTFFAGNKWILDTVSEYNQTEKTGMRQAVYELKYLVREAPLYLFRSVGISLIKYTAFKYGLNRSLSKKTNELHCL